VTALWTRVGSGEQAGHWVSEYETQWRLDRISRPGDRGKRTDLGDGCGGFGMLADRVTGDR